MNALEAMIEEMHRYRHEEAGGDANSPGVLLRALATLCLSEGGQRSSLIEEIAAGGFLPAEDRYNPVTGLKRPSLDAVAHAFGVSVPMFLPFLDEFFESGIAMRHGFSYDQLFPCDENECVLH